MRLKRPACSILLILAACTTSRPLPSARLPIPARFELVAVDGRPLPAEDMIALERVFGGSIELFRVDSLRLVLTYRDLLYEWLPCSALRTMAEEKGTVGIGAMTDSAKKGCDELRPIEADTQVVAYERRGDRLQIADSSVEVSADVRANVIVRVSGDTITIEQELRHVTVGGQSDSMIRSRRYVRTATPRTSRAPQN